MFIQSLNAELNPMYVLFLKFHSICCFFKRLAWLGMVKSIIAAARVSFAVNTVLIFKFTYLEFIDSYNYKHHATAPKYEHCVHLHLAARS